MNFLLVGDEHLFTNWFEVKMELKFGCAVGFGATSCSQQDQGARTIYSLGNRYACLRKAKAKKSCKFSIGRILLRFASMEESLSRTDLDNLLDHKIRAITRLAYDHNPFLHSLFQKAGINPHSDIYGRADLLKAYEKGVRTSAADVQECYADYADQIPTLEVWSSGSTSKPKRVLVSSDGIERAKRGQERLLVAAGVSNGQRILGFPAPPPYATSYAFQCQASLKNLKIRTLVFRLPTITLKIGREEKERIARSYIEMIGEFNPDHVRGGVFALYKFAQFLTSNGFDTSRLSIKSAIFSGDPTTEEERKDIGRLWNAEPFDLYGTTEAGILSYECHAHSGLHVNEGDLFLSAVDPKSGEEVGQNTEGIDLSTCLFEDNELPGTFLINYSHGDHIRMLQDTCPCGNNFKLSSRPRRDFEKRLISGFGST